MDLFELVQHDSVLERFLDVRREAKEQGTAKPDKELAKRYARVLNDLEEECRILDLAAVADLIDMTSFNLTAEGGALIPTFHELEERLNTIELLLMSQATKLKLLRLTSEESEAFDNNNLF